MDEVLDYTWETVVSTFDCDLNRRLRPSFQLKLQQELGERHMNAGGLSYADLYGKGIVFVLTRAAAKIFKAPRMGEDIKMCTWSRGVHSSQYFRCYDFCAADGSPFISAVSSFVIIDPITRRLKRPSVIDNMGMIKSTPERANDCCDPKKILLPDDMEHAGVRLVRYSDIDYNSHMNNTVYADILCDFAHEELSSGAYVSEFTIQFVNEAKLGDELDIYVSKAGGLISMKATTDRGVCFTAEAGLSR